MSKSNKLGLKELIAIGVGGMIGGGIFSVLGLAVNISGHAAPLAFGLGSLIAAIAGYSYVKLALTYRSDGASFTYLERAFPKHPNIGGIAGWMVVVGYIGTLSLYAFTFGAYGADLLGTPHSIIARLSLSTTVLLFFMVVNLIGVKASGVAEDIVVYSKIVLLSLFGLAGIFNIKQNYISPLVNKGTGSIFVAGAIIFVAYEGFQLITNAVMETKNPSKNIPQAIYGSVTITSLIYITLAIVAVGSLTTKELISAKEYALAVAAQPLLGNVGPTMVDLAALLATSSAINGTAFGAARMMYELAKERMMPKVFSFRNRTEVPWLAIVVLTILSLAFSLAGGLEIIAAFSSITFLLVSSSVSIANLVLRDKTKSNIWIITIGIIIMTFAIVLLVYYLWKNQPYLLTWIGVSYLGVIATELLFSKRRLILRKASSAISR